MLKIWVFIDFWNLQLTLNNKHGSAFHPDWSILGGWLADKAANLVKRSGTLEGVSVYSSYDPNSSDDMKHHKWATGWLSRQPGFYVLCSERKPKNLPHCSTCHEQIKYCPNCKARMKNTVEKGVDAAIATDLIRLAWEDAYDVGVLVTLDADLIPAVEFIAQKGRKIVHGGFPPMGAALSRACWGVLDLFEGREEYRRR